MLRYLKLIVIGQPDRFVCGAYELAPKLDNVFIQGVRPVAHTLRLPWAQLTSYFAEEDRLEDHLSVPAPHAKGPVLSFECAPPFLCGRHDPNQEIGDAPSVQADCEQREPAGSSRLTGVGGYHDPPVSAEQPDRVVRCTFVSLEVQFEGVIPSVIPFVVRLCGPPSSLPAPGGADTHDPRSVSPCVPV